MRPWQGWAFVAWAAIFAAMLLTGDVQAALGWCIALVAMVALVVMGRSLRRRLAREAPPVTIGQYSPGSEVPRAVFRFPTGHVSSQMVEEIREKLTHGGAYRTYVYSPENGIEDVVVQRDEVWGRAERDYKAASSRMFYRYQSVKTRTGKCSRRLQDLRRVRASATDANLLIGLQAEMDALGVELAELEAELDGLDTERVVRYRELGSAHDVMPRDHVPDLDRDFAALSLCRFGHYLQHGIADAADGMVTRECGECSPPTRWRERA